jgi:hypothetical protein
MWKKKYEVFVVWFLLKHKDNFEFYIVKFICPNYDPYIIVTIELINYVWWMSLLFNWKWALNNINLSMVSNFMCSFEDKNTTS